MGGAGELAPTRPPCPAPPLPRQAGGEVTVYYNPNNGALPGRERVWIK